jgi:hypothetical protein
VVVPHRGSPEQTSASSFACNHTDLESSSSSTRPLRTILFDQRLSIFFLFRNKKQNFFLFFLFYFVERGTIGTRDHVQSKNPQKRKPPNLYSEGVKGRKLIQSLEHRVKASPAGTRDFLIRLKLARGSPTQCKRAVVWGGFLSRYS